jgi:two-component system osmolarity sensor histidine kinase EnvZ
MARDRILTRLIGPRLIKRWIPTSLFARSLLIIILPIAIMQLAVTWLFFSAHEDTVTSRLAEALAGEVAAIVEIYEEDPAGLAQLQERAQGTVGLSVAFKPEDLPTSDRRNPFRSIDRTLRGALDSALEHDFWFDTTRYPSNVAIWVKVQDGSLSFIAPKDRAIATQGHIFVLYLAGATLILTAVAVLFIRNQVRAIERLAEAADSFGRGGDVSGFHPHGAREVRQAGEAFIAMRDNINRFMEQRTALLASVSHDLRTPLTRLKLELAMEGPSEQVEAMKRDLLEMEYMIDEYLEFARGEAGEAAQAAPIMEIAHAVADGARRTGAEITVEGDAALSAPLRRKAFARALTNLVDNAAAHGDKVEIRADLIGDHVLITVDDDGPGIAPERYDEAFAPFSRLDESRNQNEKGVGLGLAIARDVVRSHGGDLVLDRSPLGGLRAVIRLPV